jgi:hypothetical protein
MIVIELLLLIPIFSYLLLTQKEKTLSLSRSALAVVTASLLVGALLLFAIPKIALLDNYEYTKLTTDAWDHYFVTRSWEITGVLPTYVYSYYSNFPVTYAPQIMLSEMSGLSLFDSMTIYYLAVGIAGLLIINGIAKELIKGSKTERMIFTGISSVVYAFLQYLNLLFVQQYPLAFGAVAGLFCIYAFVSLASKRKKSFIYLGVAGVMLAIAHPFAPIFMALFFFVFFITNNVPSINRKTYLNLISRRAAAFMSLTLIVAGMIYATYVATGTFENGTEWSTRNIVYTADKLSSELFESTTSGVGQSFEGRYQTVETLIYPLNWALPAATSISMLVMYLFKKGRLEGEQLGVLLPLSIISVFMFVLTFSFSFVEFAFSRYFGAFALVFNIPLTSYIILRIVKSKPLLVKFPMLAIIVLGIFASVTDPTMLPDLRTSDEVYRDAGIYPTQLDLVTWNAFYPLVEGDSRVVLTNLNAEPIRHYHNLMNYQNEILVNPKNYTSLNDMSYVVIDQNKGDAASGSADMQVFDRIYDNSQIYIGR